VAAENQCLIGASQAQPFDGARDRIPVEYDQIFHAGAPPLPLATTRPTRVLWRMRWETVCAP